jgi:hypothetical protein
MGKETDRLPETSKSSKPGRKLATVWRALIEVGFIIFLFYSNLLMGEFIHSRDGQGITLIGAIRDLLTVPTFEIGLLCALIGFVVVEYLRQKI